MNCDLCGTVNRASARFCGGCGSALARRCPSCKAELDAGLSFCDQCGTTLDAAPASSGPAAVASSPSVGAVRKTVTVLFADLGGSTGFGERTDPEISRVVLARYHALLQDVIDAHRGTVAKFMGDGMMATFGIPEVAEDDARRAVLAGVDIQRRFEAFAVDVLARYGEMLTMRVGINTGEVVIASGDADLVGDALNVAARLEKACRPGHVLVGDETWRITRGDLAYEPLGEVTVVGRAGPVGTYEVIGTGAATTDPVAPFVGRVGETTRLRAVFDRARTDKSAVLVSVLGSPGMGKTRLSRELASTLAVDEDATTFEIRCDRSGGATFAPFADLVREAAGIAEIEDGEDAAEATRDRIGALVRDDADRGRVVDVIAGVLGAAPARSVEETFWGIRRVIESLATDRPLVVVIDDIQWAEPKLLDLLEHLAEWVQTVAVLLVCLARPELRELRPSLTEPGRRVADVLALDGLDASATAELAAGLLGSALPTELIDRLPVSTDGNPLFVRELVRMLVDDAVIRRRDDGAWELAIDAEAIEVPPTIQSLLATRVERLPAEELRVLELASVVGAEFSVGALRELAGSGIAVAPVLERLRRKELVEPTGSYWGDDPLHRFHHVLIRDAAYRRLLKTTRAELHRQVGEWTDASAGDLIGEHETAIAFHFEQAHRYRMELGTVDDETDRLGRRAAELLGVAARRALDREDLTSAGALARRALAALPESDINDRADLLLIACECFLSSGDVTAGAPLVAALEPLSGDNKQLGAWAACYRAQLIGLTDPDGVVGAEEMASTAATALASLGDGAGEAKAHQVRALLLARLGRVGEAEVVLDLALGAARASDDRRRVTAVLGAAPQAALFGPSPVARAGGRCLDVVRLLRITTASPSVEATSMRCQAVLEALRGRFDVSRSMLASARASLEELGLRHGLLETDLFTGMVELIAGNPGAAIDPLRAAYEGLGTLGVGADAGQAAALLATALLARGEIDEAELMAGESEALAGQNLKTAIAWRIARAEVHAARGDAAAGVTVAEEAVKIAAGTDLVLDHADACVVLAELRALSGDADGAEQARADARRLYEAKGATVPAARLADARDEVVVPPVAPTLEPASSAMPTDARNPLAENAASRFMEPLRVAFNDKDRVALAQLIASGHVHEDRRSIVGSVDLGPRGKLDEVEATIDQGFSFAEPVIVAVRGERLALSRMLTRTAAGDESPRLSVNELDSDGRMTRSVLFDEDDLVAALAELDDWYLTGEDAGIAEAIRPAVEHLAAFHARDWDPIADSMRDTVVIDHRGLWPDTDADGYVERMQSLVQTIPDAIVIARKFHVHGDAVLMTAEVRATSDHGERYDYTFHTVTHPGRFEYFDETDFATALARLDQLGTWKPEVLELRTPRTAAVRNRATEALVMGMAMLNADPRNARSATEDGIRSGVISPDMQREDHRRVVGSPTIADGDDFAAEVGAMFGVFDRIDVDPVAVRGEQLTLVRLRCVREPDFESTWLALYEFDGQGRMTHEIDFDDDDLPEALAKLDAAYFVGEGAAFQRVLRAAGRYATASDAGDLDAMSECLAGDFVVVDHQPLGFGAGDRDYFVDMRRLAEADLEGVNRVLHVSEHAILAVYLSNPITDEGARYERAGSVVMGVDASARVNRIEMYADDDFDAALTRFDELGAGAPADPRRAAAENATTKLIARTLDLMNRGDWDTLATMNVAADGVVRFDRRRTVSAPTLNDSESFGANAAGIYEVFGVVRSEPVAVRGERLALIRLHCGEAPTFTMQMLVVYELDDDGRIVREVDFDGDDLVAALGELDERYLSGEGAGHERVLRICRAFEDVNNRRDFEATQSMLAPDFTMADRTRLGFGVGGRGYFDAANRSREAVAADDSAVVRMIEVEGDGLLAVVEGHRVTPEGNDYTWNSCIVLQVDTEDRIRRAEYYDEDHYATARARLHELGTRESATPVANPTTRVVERFFDHLAAHRFDEAEVLMDPAFEHLDRRSIVSNDSVGREQTMANNRAVVEMGFDDIELTTVAVRGERLALVRARFRTAGGDEMPALMLQETNEEGLRTRYLGFDPDNLDAALDELDERHIAGEGADHEYLIRRIGDFRHARAARDWDGVEALFSPEYVGVDRRRLGLGTGTRSGYLAAARAMVELVPDATFVPRLIETRGDLVLLRTAGSGTSVDGSRSEWEQWVVWQFAAGCVVWGEVFALEDEAVARARFDELATKTLTPYVDNRLVRIGVRAQWLGRFTDARRAFYGDDCVLEDRRPGVNAGTVQGAAAVDASVQSGVDVFGVLEIDWLAVRGDRLALNRWAFVADSGFEAPGLSVIELDEDDLVCRVTSFEESDLAGAIAFLEERHVELRGDAITSQELTTAIGSRAFNARDWDELGQVYAADVRFVLHTPFRTEGGWDDYLAQLQVLVEQVPDVALVFAKVTTRGRCGLSLLPFTGTTPEGSRYSWSMVQVTRMGEDGLIAEFELFDIEQWGDAAACFERWVADSDTSAGAGRATSIENTASRLTAEAARGFGVEGGSGSGHLADDLVRVDHRRMIGVPTTTTREEFADAATAFADLGMTDMTFDVHAVRGDRCCLGRLTYSGADFDVRFLTVVACNDRNKTAWIDNFDEDDLDAALDTLDERFIAGEGAEHHNVIRWWREFGAAYRDRDWAAVEEMYVSDAVLVDHRSIGQGWNDRADFLTSTRAVVELVPDVRHLPRWLEIRGHVTLTDGEASGTTSDGSRYSWGYHMVTQWAGGRITRLEIFDATEPARARARFEELAGEEPPVAASPATPAQQVSAAFAARDWEWIRDQIAPDAVLEDRRSTVSSHRAFGADAVVDLFRGWADVGFQTLEDIPLASRGNRLVLRRRVYRTETGFEIETLVVIEFRVDRKMVAITLFDVDAMVPALDELELRYARSGAMSRPERSALVVCAALNHRRWSEFDAILASDVEVVDHRRLGFPPATGPVGLVHALQSLVAQVPDVVAIVTGLETSGDAVAAVVDQMGTSADGMAADWRWHNVIRVDRAGRIGRIEYFDTDDEDRARVRFEELARSGPEPVG